MALAFAFFQLDPKRMATAEGLTRLLAQGRVPVASAWAPDVAGGAVWAALVAGVALAAMVGLGRRVLRDQGTLAWQWSVGFGLSVAWWFIVTAMGGLNVITAAVPLLGVLFVRTPSAPPGPRWGWALAALLLCIPLSDALAPPSDTDEIYQHLALARRMAEDGGFSGGPMLPDGSRPLPLQLSFAALYLLGGEAAPRLWHLGLFVGLLGTVSGVAERLFGRVGLGPFLMLGSYSVMVEAGLAYNDLPAAFFVLVAAERLEAGDDRAYGLAAGLALSAKYTAAPAIGALGLAHLLWRRRIPWGAALAVVPLAPWWLRNVVDGLHPLFPYAGWPDRAMVFSWPEKYGLGRTPRDFLLLPWNVLMRARTDSFAFLGRISLGWAFFPVAAWAARRHPWVFVVLLAGSGWALGPQLLRYLLPLVGLAAVVMAATPLRAPIWALIAASALQNLGPLVLRVPERAMAGVGLMPRDAYLEANVTAWPALRYLQDEVPKDAPVAMLLAWHGYYVTQPWRLGSVEDHIPTRYWLRSHPDRALVELRAQGVRYLLVGDVFFLRKDYPFLSTEQFEAELKGPVDSMRAQLERDAERVFVARRWEVWRLDTVEAPK